jgi:hypothetical protein
MMMLMKSQKRKDRPEKCQEFEINANLSGSQYRFMKKMISDWNEHPLIHALKWSEHSRMQQMMAISGVDILRWKGRIFLRVRAPFLIWQKG